jgi:hypothetical protein
MKSRHFLYYFLAFLLALGLRFIGLGAVPLTDTEATLALQALALANGENPLLSPQPGYILLTSIPFYLFESTNFLARLFPALAGSLLVFAPYFFREKLNKRVALLSTFLIAIAPGLVALSRQTSGTMLAITFGVFAWAMWHESRPQAAGVFAGIALLGGASVWMGLLIAALTWALSQNLLPQEDVEIAEASSGAQASQDRERSRIDDLKVAGTYGGGTLLLVGTLFLLSPNGLSAFFASLGEFLRGWRYASGVPATRVLGGFIAYYPFALLFGLVGGIRAILKKEKIGITLSLWALVAFLLIIFYPAHQVADLIWITLPLWVLSAKELNLHLRLPNYDRSETIGVFALTILLMAFSWLNISGAGVLSPNAEILTSRLILLGGSVLLLILSLGLIAIGWSVETATLGGAWGISLMLGLYTLSAAWGASGLRAPKGVELWDNAPRMPQTGLLLETVEEVSTMARGDATTLTVTIKGIDSPALLWALRNHNVEIVSTLDMTTAPELVITPLGEEIGLASAYRGQDFVWRTYPDWLLGGNWARWLVLREMPMQSEQIILWARNDLFFDSQN